MKILLAFMLALTLPSCTQTPRQEANSGKPITIYSLKGEVMALDGATSVATIKHEAIEGWMEAMTMGFPVKDKAEFEKLKPGQKITASVKVQGDDFWLEKLLVQP
jgi:Cu/Ag efflux protein CusF